MEGSYRKWVHIALLNLILTAFLGFLMRYKIVFALPWLHQKHILHAHSHFAFSGWITQLLMIFMVSTLGNHRQVFLRYRRLLIANLITAYGMLLSFPFQGYGNVSISFSTLSILVSYAFVIKFWKDIRSKSSPIFDWFRSAIIFLVLSSIGAFALSILMANKMITQHWYLAAVYFFLHFQYNGWFFFVCIGLLFKHLGESDLTRRYHRKIFPLFSFTCIPAYFLSVLWADLPTWLYLIVIIAAMAQVIGGIYVWKMVSVRVDHLKISWPLLSQRTGVLVLFALTIKLLLQLFSTIPSLSDLAYGFRPIVIAYLHLVLLGIISLFLLTIILVDFHKYTLKQLPKGILVFSIGILLNELTLMIQGMFAMGYIAVPYINDILLLIALLLLISSILIFFGFRKRYMRTRINEPNMP